MVYQVTSSSNLFSGSEENWKFCFRSIGFPMSVFSSSEQFSQADNLRAKPVLAVQSRFKQFQQFILRVLSLQQIKARRASSQISDHWKKFILFPSKVSVPVYSLSVKPQIRYVNKLQRMACMSNNISGDILMQLVQVRLSVGQFTLKDLLTPISRQVAYFKTCKLNLYEPRRQPSRPAP